MEEEAVSSWLHGSVILLGRRLDPLNSLAHFPDTLPLLAFFDVDTFSMLLSLAPLANILPAIGPLESAVAVLLIILVAADVAPAIAPGEGALALHFVVDPLAAVDTTIGPFVFAFSVNIILKEISFIGTLI